MNRWLGGIIGAIGGSIALGSISGGQGAPAGLVGGLLLGAAVLPDLTSKTPAKPAVEADEAPDGDDVTEDVEAFIRSAVEAGVLDEPTATRLLTFARRPSVAERTAAERTAEARPAPSTAPAETRPDQGRPERPEARRWPQPGDRAVTVAPAGVWTSTLSPNTSIRLNDRTIESGVWVETVAARDDVILVEFDDGTRGWVRRADLGAFKVDDLVTAVAPTEEPETVETVTVPRRTPVWFDEQTLYTGVGVPDRTVGAGTRCRVVGVSTSASSP